MFPNSNNPNINNPNIHNEPTLPTNYKYIVNQSPQNQPSQNQNYSQFPQNQSPQSFPSNQSPTQNYQSQQNQSPQNYQLETLYQSIVQRQPSFPSSSDQQNYSQTQQNFTPYVQQPQLRLEVIDLPNPLITPSNFKAKQSFLINERGLDNSLNLNQKQEQGKVKIGRFKPNQGHENDIEFNERDLLVSSKQCQILMRYGKFFIQCISQFQLTYLQVTRKEFPLEEGTIFQLGSEVQFYIKKIENFFGGQSTPQFPQNMPQYQAPYISMQAGNQFSTFENQNKKLIGSRLIIGKIGYTNNYFYKSQLSNYHLEYNDIILDTSQEISSEIYYFSVGKDQKQNKIFVPHDQVSPIHCQIIWSSAGWSLAERTIPQQQNYSLNGTYVALKNYQQDIEKKPSNEFELQEQMIIWIEQTKFSVNFFI